MTVMEHPSLFDEPLPRSRHRDPQSSKAAAKRVRVGIYDARIYDLLERYRTMTKNEICSNLGLTDPKAWGTVSSRLSQLRAAGKLELAYRVAGDGNAYRIATATVETRGRV